MTHALHHAAASLAALTPPAEPIRTSLAEAFFIQRHPITGHVEWLGSLIIWLLMALSAGCLGLIGARMLDTRRERFLPLGADRLPTHDPRALRDALGTGDSLLALAAAAALDESTRNPEPMLHAAEQTIEHAAIERARRLEPLAIVGSVAPMIGLFGTVYGMILAFRQIVVAGGSPDPVELAAGIGTALTTTFWGLIVAIPALAGHAILRNRLDARTLDTWRETERLVVALTAPGQPATDTATAPRHDHAGASTP